MAAGVTEDLDKQIPMLIAIFLIMIGLTCSCTINAAKQSANSISQKVETTPSETPVPLRTTKENKGKRCAPRFYAREGREDDNDSLCYDLQSRLIDAARDGDLEKIREALRDGANPEGSVYNRYPPLQTAASSGRSEAVRLLLDNGAEVNRVTDFQNTPLNSAATNGHTEVVRVLLGRGADVCYKGSGGTAGDIAQARGFKELTELLKALEAKKCK